MEPFIGITCDVQRPRKNPEAYNLVVDHRYAEVVKAAGGYPVLLPFAWRADVIDAYLAGIDGLVIVGGDDVDPRLYGERPRRGTGAVFAPRLRFERRLYARARRAGMPILGICYGMQLINVLEGGTLFQDIRRDAHSTLNHRDRRQPVHTVRLARGSKLGHVLRARTARVYSEHHQAVCRVAPGFRPVALALDGIIEAIECDDSNILAVQWHPERTPRSLFTRRLVATFVRRAGG